MDRADALVEGDSPPAEDDQEFRWKVVAAKVKNIGLGLAACRKWLDADHAVAAVAASQASRLLQVLGDLLVEEYA